MRLQLAVTLALFVFSASTADAQLFRKERLDWQKMSPESKAAYAIGAFDESVTVYAEDPKELQTRKVQLLVCIDMKQAKAADLAEMIDQGYESDPNLSSYPPNMVLGQQIAKLCPAEQ